MQDWASTPNLSTGHCRDRHNFTIRQRGRDGKSKWRAHLQQERSPPGPQISQSAWCLILLTNKHLQYLQKSQGWRWLLRTGLTPNLRGYSWYKWQKSSPAPPTKIHCYLPNPATPSHFSSALSTALSMFIPLNTAQIMPGSRAYVATIHALPL